MENFSVIEAKKEEKSREIPMQGESAINSPKNEHEQAVNFVESHRDILEHYARGRITIEPAPEGLSTFAFNLEENTIYINSMFYKELGLSDERTIFASFHEIEHFLEKKQILAEDGGAQKFKKYLDRIKKSRSFSLTDNCVADVHVNRTVISKSNEGMSDVEVGMYKEVLFKDKDFTKAPRHIQFAQALLREARVPDEMCVVDPDVRMKLDQIKGMKGKSGLSLMDVMTAPDTSMSDRLALQDRFIIPIVEELKKKDVEEEKKKRQKQKDEQKKNEQENKGNGKGEKGEGGEKDEESEDGEKDEESEDGEEGEKKEGQDGGGEGDFDPNEVWKEEYDKADKATPNAVSREDLEKVLEEYKKAEKAKVKSEKEIQEQIDKEYADSIGVEKCELQKYRELIKELESIVDPETDRNVIEELRELISKIIAKRKKKKTNPKYPVEEGESLVEPAELVAEVKKGNLSPRVWETYDLKEKRDNKFGEVEISLICDRSGSMEGEKLEEQQKAAVLMMEALKELGDMCKEEGQSANLSKPLEVRSEIYSFQSTGRDGVPIKPMSVELSEKDRITSASRLGSCEGSTTDFIPLETIAKGIDDEVKKKIHEGELKKIVIIFTDGGSDSPDRVKTALKDLREAGVVVAGVGITKSGEQALTTYAPDARLADTAKKLPAILGDLLKEHLSAV